MWLVLSLTAVVHKLPPWLPHSGVLLGPTVLCGLQLRNSLQSDGVGFQIHVLHVFHFLHQDFDSCYTVRILGGAGSASARANPRSVRSERPAGALFSDGGWKPIRSASLYWSEGGKFWGAFHTFLTMSRLHWVDNASLYGLSPLPSFTFPRSFLLLLAGITFQINHVHRNPSQDSTKSSSRKPTSGTGYWSASLPGEIATGTSSVVTPDVTEQLLRLFPARHWKWHWMEGEVWGNATALRLEWHGDSSDYKGLWSWLTSLPLATLQTRVTDVGQATIDAGYTMRRSSVAAFEKMVTACDDRTADAKAGLGFNLKSGRAVYVLWWVCTVSTELNWEWHFPELRSGFWVNTGHKRYFEQDLKAEVRQQSSFFYMWRLVLGTVAAPTRHCQSAVSYCWHAALTRPAVLLAPVGSPPSTS